MNFCFLTTHPEGIKYKTNFGQQRIKPFNVLTFEKSINFTC